jgi:hypothetical protein
MVVSLARYSATMSRYQDIASFLGVNVFVAEPAKTLLIELAVAILVVPSADSQEFIASAESPCNTVVSLLRSARAACEIICTWSQGS